MRAARLAPVIALMIGACGAQEIAFDTPDAAGMADGGAGDDGGLESSGATGCASDLDCPLGLGLHCDARISGGQCVPCVTNSHCTQPGHRICDIALNLCVECGVPGDCASSLCVNTRCLPSCADGGLCPDYSMCQSPVCIECLTNRDCTGSRSGQICDTSIGQCVECVHDTQCLRDQQCNPTNGRCVECLTSQSCPAGEACDPSSHMCADVAARGQVEGGVYFPVDAGSDAYR